MRRALHLAAVMMVLGAAVTALQKPNFSGTWVVVSPADSVGQEENIKHDDATLTLGHKSEGGGHSFTYKLDGSESRNVISPHGDDQVVGLAKASWAGEALVIVETITYPTGRKREMRRTWSLDAKGQLQLEVVQSVDGKPQPPVTLTYKKRT